MDKITARHILVEKEHEAQDLVKKLDSGENFAALAKDFSLCGSAAQGGDLGPFGKGMMVAPFEEAAFSLNPGERSDVVQTQFGYHIIERTK